MTNKIHYRFILTDDVKGMRLDQALAKTLPELSRAQIQEWIKRGEVMVNQAMPKAKMIVSGGEQIHIQGSQRVQPHWQAQPIRLNVLYEDDALLVINKPVGMVVHPGAGNLDQTLLNALLHHAPVLAALPRAGIVHRLDKNTSGLLVIAKTAASLKNLIAQMKAKSILRVYQAIVYGLLIAGGTIDAPIGRHPIQRKRMAVTESGKRAVTHYRVIEKYRNHTRLKIQLETGRTHQIRVHMAHIHHPILGDPVYQHRLQLPKGASPELITLLRQFKHQALHAFELSLIHPETKKPMHWQAPLPEAMQEVINLLKADTHYDK